jgi:kynureninase
VADQVDHRVVGLDPEFDAAAARIERLLSAAAGTVVMQQNVSSAMAVVASCFDYGAPGAAGRRNKVVYEASQFPTVSYVWQAEERRGARCVVVPSKPTAPRSTPTRCATAIDERTALVVPMSARGVLVGLHPGRQEDLRPGRARSART